MTAAAVFTQNDIENFPFPFPKDQYRYSANVEPTGQKASTVVGSWGNSEW